MRRSLGVCYSCESLVRLVILINEILMEHALGTRARLLFFCMTCSTRMSISITHWQFWCRKHHHESWLHISLTFLIVQSSRAPHRTLSVRDSINSQRVYRAIHVTAIHKTFMTPAYPRPNNNIKMHFINCTCQLAISAQLFFINNLLNYSFSIISLAIQCILIMALAGSSVWKCLVVLHSSHFGIARWLT